MSDETLQEFPSDFPIKVMGRHDSNLRALTQAIIERHAGPVGDASVRTRTSGDGATSPGVDLHGSSIEPQATRRYLQGTDGLQVRVDGALSRCALACHELKLAQEVRGEAERRRANFRHAA